MVLKCQKGRSNRTQVIVKKNVSTDGQQTDEETHISKYDHEKSYEKYSSYTILKIPIISSLFTTKIFKSLQTIRILF